MKFIPADEIFRDPAARRGLPAWTYNNAELTELEMQQIFLRNWMFVAHVSDLPRPGDYQCFEMANERAVVVRDNDGEIRAFHNVCRHRGGRSIFRRHTRVCGLRGRLALYGRGGGTPDA